MSKPATRKPGVKRRRKTGWDIDRRSIEAEWEAALLQMPEEILGEEIAFWSWPDTPEGQQWIEISDKLDVLLKDVGVDAEERKLIWPDATRLDSRSIHSAYQQTVSLLSRRQHQGVSDLLASSAKCYVGRLLKVADGQTSETPQPMGCRSRGGGKVVTLEIVS